VSLSRTISSQRSSASQAANRALSGGLAPPVEGETQFTDEAVDWIETVANDDES
jgi:hypothetical protein